MTAPTKPTPGRTVRTALVLGGGSDIALATVGRLARRGLSHVVLAAREPDRSGRDGRGAAPSLQVEPVAWDATQTDSHPRLVGLAQETLGQIDLVLSAVGQLGHHAGLGMSPEDIVSMVDANFAGPAAAVAAVSDALVGRVGAPSWSSPRSPPFARGSRTTCTDRRRRGWTRSPRASATR